MGATEASTTDKFATVPRFLLVMQCFTFIIRHLQILLWSKTVSYTHLTLPTSDLV